MATSCNVHPYVFKHVHIVNVLVRVGKQASVGVRTQHIYINSYRCLPMQRNCVLVVVISTYHVDYC